MTTQSALYRDRLTAMEVSIDADIAGNNVSYLGQAVNFQHPTLLEEFVEEPTGTGFNERVYMERAALMTCSYELNTFSPEVALLWGRYQAASPATYPTSRFEAKTSAHDLNGKRIITTVTGRIFGWEPGAAAPDGTWTFPIQQDCIAYKVVYHDLTVNPINGSVTQGAEVVLFDISIPANRFMVGTYDRLAAMRQALGIT